MAARYKLTAPRQSTAKAIFRGPELKFTRMSGANLGGWSGRVGAYFFFLVVLLVVAAGVLAAVIVVITVRRTHVERVQHNAHNPGIHLHQQLRRPPQSSLGGLSRARHQDH